MTRRGDQTPWVRQYDQSAHAMAEQGTDVTPVPFVNRRVNPDIYEAILDRLDGLQSQLGREHAQNTTSIDVMKDDVEQALREVKEMRKELSGAFPGGDAEAHRRYHESVIEWRELRNKMVREALSQAAKGGFLVGLGWIAYALWQAFKMELTK